MNKEQRKYHIVLLGATGYTGRLAAEYMARAVPDDTPWAIAGRGREKLEALAAELKLNDTKGSVYALDLASDEEITLLAKSTRVLINVIGPYATTCGSAVIKACAENGTDYVDCNGEMPWLQDMIQKYDTVALSTGSKLITTSGFTAIAADLGTYLASKHIPHPLREILISLDAARAGFSGGSIHSLAALISTYTPGRIAAATALFALSPIPQPSTPRANGVLPAMGMFGLQRVPGFGTLVVSPQEGIERAVVGRSWGLMQGVYGREMFFSSRMRVENVLAGWLNRVVYVLLTRLLVFSLVRRLVKRVFPAGTGASAEERRGRFFRYRVLGIAEEGGKRAEVGFSYEGDTYEFTGMALVEAALVLLDGGTRAHERGGGFMTPAMLGEKYVDRLTRPGAGAKIEVKVLDE